MNSCGSAERIQCILVSPRTPVTLCRIAVALPPCLSWVSECVGVMWTQPLSIAIVWKKSPNPPSTAAPVILASGLASSFSHCCEGSPSSFDHWRNLCPLSSWLWDVRASPIRHIQMNSLRIWLMSQPWRSLKITSLFSLSPSWKALLASPQTDPFFFCLEAIVPGSPTAWDIIPYLWKCHHLWRTNYFRHCDQKYLRKQLKWGEDSPWFVA